MSERAFMRVVADAAEIGMVVVDPKKWALYNPATHQVVPKGAVVLEAEHVDTLVDLAAQAIQPWWKDEPRLDYKERFREGHDAIEHAESALASAQESGEEGNGDEP